MPVERDHSADPVMTHSTSSEPSATPAATKGHPAIAPKPDDIFPTLHWRQLERTIIFVTATASAILYTSLIVYAHFVLHELDTSTLFNTTPLVAGGIVGAIALFLTTAGPSIWFSLVPLRWDCPNPKCQKRLNGDIPWICGSCDHENRRSLFSFLSRCGNFACLKKPKAFTCPKCGVLSYFTADRDGHNAAKSADVSNEPAPVTEEQVQKQRQQELASKQHEVETLLLELEVAKLKGQLSPVPEQIITPRQAGINWLAERLQSARDKCKTLQQTVALEVELKADLDVQGYDQALTERMKQAVEMDFEETRRKLGVPDVRI